MHQFPWLFFAHIGHIVDNRRIAVPTLKWPGGRLVLLVDALDELGGERRDAVLASLGRLSTSAAMEGVSIVVTCRTRQDQQHALPEYENYSILELSEHAVSQFIRINRDAKSGTLGELERRLVESGFLGPGGLGRNPFWLGQLILIGTHERTRSGILRTAARQALLRELSSKPGTPSREWRRPRAAANDQIVNICVAALGRLARGMDLSRDIPRKAAREVIAKWLKETAPLPNQGLSADFILLLSRDAGLLKRSDDPLEFGHKLLQEYLTAEDLAAGARDEASLGKFLSDANRWQTFSICAGLLPDEQRTLLVESLLGDATSPKTLACVIAAHD
jgi:hypothetical protein